MKFYLTFGQKSPFRNGFVEVRANSYEEARKKVFYIFGDKFAFLYEAKDFEHHGIEMFSAGRIGEVLFV